MRATVLGIGLVLGLAAPLASAAPRHAPTAATAPASAPCVGAAAASIRRLAPAIADRFVLRPLHADVPAAFRISGADDRIVLEGSDCVALLVAFRHYLTKVAHGSISRTGDRLPSALPIPAAAIAGETRLPVRGALNFTVAGYTSPFWTWAEWERELDLLAYSGVNQALVTIGTEAVWFDLLRSQGYDARQAAAWISPAAHFPWQLMANLQGFDGGVTPAYVERRAVLGRRILERMRELGIRPILPGFSGMVPSEFARRFPRDRVILQGEWFGFERPAWLDPATPRYAELAALYYAAQRRRFGAVDDQAIDILHEGGTAEGVDVGAASQGIVDALKRANPDYRWVVQAWTGNPRPETLAVLEPGHALVQDLTGDAWIKANAFGGIPWLWGVLPNFGGRSLMYGNMPKVAETLPQLAANPLLGQVVGTANMSEGLDTNTMLWDLWSDSAWETKPLDLRRWIANWTHARYGVADAAATSAWERVVDTAYDAPQRDGSGAEPLYAAAPDLAATKASTWTRTTALYEAAELREGLRHMLDAGVRLGGVPTYRHDLADMARQVAADRSRELLPRIRAAVAARDLPAFRRERDGWLALMDLTDEMLAGSEHFRLDTWVNGALRHARTDAERRRARYDAQSLVSVWGSCSGEGPQLLDYSNRDWAGLIGSYYRPRWTRYLDSVERHLQSGTPIAVANHCEEAMAWASGTPHTRPPGRDAALLAGEILREASR